MEIYREIVDLIAEAVAESCEREIGGILGADRGELICEAVVDNTPSEKWYTYTPNTEFLNEVIMNWDWNFIGIFHSHLNGQSSLSVGDKAYIERIMGDMPAEIDHLYFPLYVMPENRLYGFKATRTKGEITISEEAVDII